MGFPATPPAFERVDKFLDQIELISAGYAIHLVVFACATYSFSEWRVVELQRLTIPPILDFFIWPNLLMWLQICEHIFWVMYTGCDTF